MPTAVAKPPPENWQLSEAVFTEMLDAAGVRGAAVAELGELGVTTVAAWDEAPASVFGDAARFLSDAQFDAVTAAICQLERAAENVVLKEDGVVLKLVLEEAGALEFYPEFERRALMHPSQLTSLIAADALAECVGGDETVAARVLEMAKLYEEEARTLLEEEEEELKRRRDEAAEEAGDGPPP